MFHNYFGISDIGIYCWPMVFYIYDMVYLLCFRYENSSDVTVGHVAYVR